MFSIRVLGVLLIFIACSFAGFLKSKALYQRRKKLSLLLDGTAALYNYIDQGEFELEFAIKNAFEKCRFLNFSGSDILCEDVDLKKDKNLIEEFFFGLGCATKKIECEHINRFIIKLKTHLKDADDDVISKSKIYQILGICSGLLIGILVI